MVKTEQKIKQEETSSKQMPSSNISAAATTTAAASTSKKIKKYKGVRMRSWGSWVSEIRAPNQKTRIWLGSYSTAEAAARAYDAALLCLKGSSANLNFPITSSHYIPADTVMSPKSIQRFAAAAANSFSNDNTNNDINAITHTTNPPISPPLPSSTSSTLSSTMSSPSSSSSPSDQLDDDASLMMQSLGSYSEPLMMEPFSSWYNFDYGFQSPNKYVDQMFISGVSSFDHPPLLPLTIDDYLLGDEDIRLWSFC